ncbi:hypothetical protein C8R45DRAFT_836782 [Mycena sanguinolenta]|nr:hypothetical protein C8R45DRAFT_836782 [Mycena sanguinolenta]
MHVALPRRAVIPLIRSSPDVVAPGEAGALVFGRIAPDSEELPDLDDVQGDVVYQFPKRAENFIFFRISSDVASFRTALRSFRPSSSKDTGCFVYKIAEQRISGRPETMEKVGYQIAFTRMGMNYLGVRDATGDARFDRRAMRDDKDLFGDQEQWDVEFDKKNPDPINGSAGEDAGALHGVISIAASGKRFDFDQFVKASDATISQFGASIQVISTLEGRARPNETAGHEHFGYKDGTSQPALRHLLSAKPGQIEVNPGVIIMGYKGDPVFDNPDLAARPNWTKGGTIMVFRKLEQDVGGFNEYLKKNGRRWREFAPPGCPELSDEEGAELWGARLVGRWKSGAPLALSPFRDDPQLAADPNRHNDFDYRVRDVDISPRDHTDRFCPFSAHIRKTVPRDLDPYVQRSFLESSMIIRVGIPYGPEFKQDPRAQRGLLFVCYQSDLDQGFVRQTKAFATNDYFPTTSLFPTHHGQDPLIGSLPSNKSSAAVNEVTFVRAPRVAPKSGDKVNLVMNLNNDRIEVSGFAKVRNRTTADPPGVPQDFFVTSHGGEYFFVPPISTVKAWAVANTRVGNSRAAPTFRI